MRLFTIRSCVTVVMRYGIAVSGALGAPVAMLAAQADTHAHGADSHGPARLGTVTFPTSGKPRAQAAFVRGIAFLHSFHYEEAAREFQNAQRADSAFALPYWFEAFTHSHLLWGEDEPDVARDILARLGPTLSSRLARVRDRRERGYAAAIEAFYADTAVGVRARAFADSMRGVTARYPADLEAAAFASLGIMMAIDEDAYPAADRPARSAQMIDLAERVFTASPNHPGAAHYLIHVSDLDVSFTRRSLPAARAYARIAPDASHALHMPSHVFLRLGLWDEVASSNERSWAASRREMARDHLSGADLDSHSLKFLIYAYLETGRWRAARALVDSARNVIGDADMSSATHVDGRFAVSELMFLYASGTDRWNDAVFAPVTTSPQNQREQGFALAGDYARVVILAMRGDTAALAKGAADFRRRADAAPSPRLDYLAAELEGLTAKVRGDRVRAIERFAHAGALEDGAPVVGPPWYLIAREQLGALYLDAGRADSAALQFEQVLVNQPNRTSALVGLARARKALGETDAAAKAYAAVVANWHRADAGIPGLEEARAGAAGRTGNR